MKTRGLFLLSGMIFFLLSSGQSQESNEKNWSATDRLTPDDFQLHIEVPPSSPCFAQFSLNYSLNGFDYFKKNFNQKVTNVMLTNASWIDSEAEDLERLLHFQQILFDLSEVYAREFRKRLLENRKALIKDNNLVRDIEAGIMQEFIEQRALFEQESRGGTNREVMVRWQQDIELRLQSLHIYRFENDEKIK